MKKVIIRKITKEEIKELQEDYAKDIAEQTGRYDLSKTFEQIVDENRNQTLIALKYIKDSQTWNDIEKLLDIRELIKKVEEAKEYIVIEDSMLNRYTDIIKLRPAKTAGMGQVTDTGFIMHGGRMQEKYLEIYLDFKDAEEYVIEEKGKK